MSKAREGKDKGKGKAKPRAPFRPKKRGKDVADESSKPAFDKKPGQKRVSIPAKYV